MRSFAKFTKVGENYTKLDLTSQTAKETIRLNQRLQGDLTVDSHLFINTLKSE